MPRVIISCCALGTPRRGSIQNAPEVNPFSGCAVVPATTQTATCEQCDTPGPSASHSVVEQNLFHVTTVVLRRCKKRKVTKFSKKMVDEVNVSTAYISDSLEIPKKPVV